MLTGCNGNRKVTSGDDTLARKVIFGALAAACAAMLAASSAIAQVRQNDVRAEGILDLFYKVNADWTLNVYGKILRDHDISRWNDVEFRSNAIYSFSPTWSAAAGYVQFQPIETTARTERGTFQDLSHRIRFDKLGMHNRLRINETFADKSSTLRIFSSYLLSLQHPIGASDWFAYLTDQPYFNLKVDGTGRQAGFYLNKTTLGIGRTIAPGMVATLGYELSEVNVPDGHYMQHTFLLGLDIRFN